MDITNKNMKFHFYKHKYIGISAAAPLFYLQQLHFRSSLFTVKNAMQNEFKCLNMGTYGLHWQLVV